MRLALAEAEYAGAPMPSVNVVRDRLITGVARGYAAEWGPDTSAAPLRARRSRGELRLIRARHRYQKEAGLVAADIH